MQGRHKGKRRLSLALAELILVSLAETHNTLFMYLPQAHRCSFQGSQRIACPSFPHLDI